MPVMAHPAGAADLLAQGTYALRHALDRLAHHGGAGPETQEVQPMFQKLLLAVDGSEHGARAVPVAADIAKKSDGEVVVFHVREYGIARAGTYPLENGLHAKELVDAVTAELTAAGVKARGVVEPSIVGEAAKAILKEAEADQVDAIVMGCRGRSELTGLLLGSVAHKVIQLSRCPVVVAR